ANMARSKLKAIAIATHHPNPNRVAATEELIGREMMVKVVVKNDANKVQKCEPISGVSIGENTPPPMAPTSTPTQNAATPWG
ncbi:MAG: hypothetical protein IK079_00250, partial [Desulfovibrio sp.]|nr:hypothetical protein [Desulfovibrio sp.]